jgi:hypothetical protein
MLREEDSIDEELLIREYIATELFIGDIDLVIEFIL